MEQFSALSTEELIARKKRLKGILAGVMIVACILALAYAYRYFLLSKPMSAGTLVSLLVLPVTWLPIITSLRSLSAEINSREKAI